MNTSPEQIHFDFSGKSKSKKKQEVPQGVAVEKGELRNAESLGECKQCGNEFDSAGSCWSCLRRPEKDKYRAL